MDKIIEQLNKKIDFLVNELAITQYKLDKIRDQVKFDDSEYGYKEKLKKEMEKHLL